MLGFSPLAAAPLADDGAISVAISMVADSGSFTLTGVTLTNLSVQDNFLANTGVFTTTGQDVEFIEGKSLAVDVGNFTTTGLDSVLNLNAVEQVTTGIFTTAGQDTALNINSVLSADAGTFTATAQAADDFIRGQALTADTGSFSLILPNRTRCKSN